MLKGDRVTQHSVIATGIALCYNFDVLGNSLAVGQRTLDKSDVARLLTTFLKSRREGLSPRTIDFYKGYLERAQSVVGINITGQQIARFLDSLDCTNGGKHAYYRALRAFYTWLYSRRSGFDLNPQANPILLVDSPKVEKRIMSSLTEEQIEHLTSKVDSLRDECIIRLFADSGMRLMEMTRILPSDIDWQTNTVTIIGKGNKQRRAPFTERTARMLRTYLADNHNGNGNIWGITHLGIQDMLKRLAQDTGIRCNPHSFRRGFACNLHRKGLSTLDIMHLGGWADLGMVLRYTRSITFEDCLKHYRGVDIS